MSLASHLQELAGDGTAEEPRPRHQGAESRGTATGRLFMRARAYVATVDPAVSGQGGHSVTWRVARKLAQDFGLSEEQTFSILWSDYNPRCLPPWSQRELRHKAHQAVAKARVTNPVDEEEHWRMPDAHDPGPSAAVAGSSPNDGHQTEPAWLGVSEIFEPLPPMQWLVQALDMAGGAPALLAGYGFSGKTVAAQALAVSVAAGMPAWGQLNVRRGVVRHFDFEQGARLTRERYQRLAMGMSVSPAELDGRLALWALPRFTFDSEGAEDKLCRWLEGVDLAIIDSYRAACPAIDENSSEARLPLDMLARVSERTGCVPLVIHHARKPSQNSAGGAKMAIRGSGALFDACSSVLCFEGIKGAPTRVSHEKARNTGRPANDFALRVRDTDGGGLLVAMEGAAGDGVAVSPDERFTALQEQVREFFRANGAQGDKDVIRERLGVRKQSLVAAMGALITRGELVQGGTRKAPTWALAQGVQP
jgi:hypothetical protein